MDEVRIKITAEDFNRLWNTHTTWGYGFGGQLAEGRFETVNGEMSTRWRQAYWMGDDYAKIILARSWLSPDNYAVVWDTALAEYVLLTQYNWEIRMAHDAGTQASQH